MAQEKNIHTDGDLAYMRSLSAAVLQRSPKRMIMILLVIALFFLCAIFWMNWASIDVVVRGSGKVIPARQVQQVQSLEGGVVAEILAKEGDLVEAGQPLLKLSDVAFASSFQENRLKYDELRAKSVRLQAEAYDREFVDDENLKQTAKGLLVSEKSLYETNKQQLSETLSIYEEQMLQQQKALEEAHSNTRQLKKQLDFLNKNIAIQKPLMEKRLISEIDFLQLQQKEAELSGKLEIANISISRIQSSIDEAKGKLEQSRLDFRNKAKRELNEVLAEISRISEAQTALEDRVSRTTLRSPVKGVVKRLHSNSIGGVVAPGAQIVEIVPLGDSLLVEVQIKPADIASIDVGQKTRLKFSAYDFAIHGSLSGEVVFISADTITDEEGKSFYTVRVTPDQAYIGHENKPMPIKVGMTSEADIITDKKTILEYILKPIHRGLQKSLTEG
jgi:adhesin transport system membrane fusion protein